MELKGSKTEQNLKDAFRGESQANRGFMYFAAKADLEGENDVAAVVRSAAERDTGHAHGHLEYPQAVGDPVSAYQLQHGGIMLTQRRRVECLNKRYLYLPLWR
jgi:rubrerythrin